jgi:hypothetical protein
MEYRWRANGRIRCRWCCGGLCRCVWRRRWRRRGRSRRTRCCALRRCWSGRSRRTRCCALRRCWSGRSRRTRCCAFRWCWSGRSCRTRCCAFRPCWSGRIRRARCCTFRRCWSVRQCWGGRCCRRPVSRTDLGRRWRLGRDGSRSGGRGRPRWRGGHGRRRLENSLFQRPGLGGRVNFLARAEISIGAAFRRRRIGCRRIGVGCGAGARQGGRSAGSAPHQRARLLARTCRPLGPQVRTRARC